LRTPAPQELKPMGLGSIVDKLVRKGGQKAMSKPKQLPYFQQKAKNIRTSELFKLANTPLGRSVLPIGGATYLGDKALEAISTKFTTKSAFDDDLQIADGDLAELVPQGLVGEIVGNLLTSLGPIAGELTRVLLPLSSDPDGDVHLTTQGLLDQMMQTIMPTILPSIGKMAVLLTQSIADEQAQETAPPSDAAAQPYVLPEDWRTAATHNG